MQHIPHEKLITDKFISITMLKAMKERTFIG